MTLLFYLFMWVGWCLTHWAGIGIGVMGSVAGWTMKHYD